MNAKSLNISSSGLKNLVLNKFTEEDNIILKFGEGEIIMNKIFAEFISPVVSHHLISDPTIKLINFEELFQNKSADFHIFSKDILSPDIISLIQSISSGYSIEIEQSQAFKLRFLSIILGNEELFSKINDLYPPEFSEDNLDTYIDYLHCCYHFSQFSPDFDFTGLIDYISNHFYSICEESFLKLPRKMQYLIISNPHLQIKSEDSLLDLITTIINESSEKVSKNDEKIEDTLFLEQIEFTGLSEEKLREFLSMFDINCITNSLWKKFYECFFIHFDKNPNRIFKRRCEKHTFEYIENQTGRFNGIIQYLTEKFGGNVDEKNVCRITSSSVYQNNYPKNAADFKNDHLYFTTRVDIDKSNSWLKYDFLNRKVHLTAYSIKTWSEVKGRWHLKTWVIEGSNTDRENDWKILDSRHNETCLDDSYAENTFRIQTNIDENEYFRYLRIRHTGLNSRGSCQLIIGSMEFFGTII